MLRNNLLLLAIFISILVFINTGYAQQESTTIPTQTISGKIINQKNQLPVIGATVAILNLQKGAVTKTSGNFIIKNVPVGRHSIKVSAIGYEPYIQQIVLTSGKELVLNIQLMESFVEKDEIVVTAEKNSFEAINEAVLVSSTKFTVDDVRRFAGAREDISRVAQNYAGVLGASDLRNDIIIRGGAPTELLWRLDGLDIPNPNHFGTMGATGGPVSAVNANILANSDFVTGAFPAEYIDRMSGVFDLSTRNGNMRDYEYTGQFGFNGFELMAEGPLVEDKSAFIVSYRYSFLGLLEAMGVDFGFSGIPEFQDLSFKTNYQIDDYNEITLTGLFATSNIDIQESETDDFSTGDFDIENGTDLYALIANWKHIFNKKLYMNLMLGSTTTNYRTKLDSLTVNQQGELTSSDIWFEQNTPEGYHTAKLRLFYSPFQHHLISGGFESRYRFFSFDEERFTVNDGDSERFILNETDNTFQTLSYINWNWRITEKITSNIGLSSQYLDVSGETTIEPRASIAYNFLPGQSFSLGFGVHNQSLPIIYYYSAEGNEDIEFMRSTHYVAGYSYSISNDAIIKIDGYYKDIDNALVRRDIENSYSFLNEGTQFGSTEYWRQFESTGSGRAYGGELSFIKQYNNGWYFNTAISYVRQQYKGSDGIERFGGFDNQYIFNLLGGYEWVLSPSFSIEFSGRYSHAGGGRYTPIDTELSAIRNTTEFDESRAFSERFDDYSRLDLRVDFRQNFTNWSIVSYISLENILNNENILAYQWDSGSQEIERINQLGLFFVGGFRIEF